MGKKPHVVSKQEPAEPKNSLGPWVVVGVFVLLLAHSVFTSLKVGNLETAVEDLQESSGVYVSNSCQMFYNEKGEVADLSCVQNMMGAPVDSDLLYNVQPVNEVLVALVNYLDIEYQPAYDEHHGSKFVKNEDE